MIQDINEEKNNVNINDTKNINNNYIEKNIDKKNLKIFIVLQNFAKLRQRL